MGVDFATAAQGWLKLLKGRADYIRWTPTTYGPSAARLGLYNTLTVSSPQYMWKRDNVFAGCVACSGFEQSGQATNRQIQQGFQHYDAVDGSDRADAGRFVRERAE